MLQLKAGKLRIIESSEPCTNECCELVTDQTVSLMCGASAGGAKKYVGAGNISESKAIFSLIFPDAFHNALAPFVLIDGKGGGRIAHS